MAAKLLDFPAVAGMNAQSMLPEGVARICGRGLIVEDNLLISLDIEDMLRSAGADLLDQATSVAGALQLIALNTYDFALLDFKLGNDSSLEIAAELKTRGVPFAFATGFADGTALAPDYSDVLVVTKPFATDTLIEAVVALLKR